jgi:predicted metal-dependent hydrolase
LNNLNTDDLVLHIKTGNVYVYLGEALLESTLEPYVIYRLCSTSDNVPVWVRPKSEFLDGQFTKINNPSFRNVEEAPKDHKFSAKVIFSDSYYGEDDGEAVYKLESTSKEDLKQQARRLVKEMSDVYSVDYGVPIRARSLHKVEYSWGETTFRV